MVPGPEVVAVLILFTVHAKTLPILAIIAKIHINQ